MTDNRNASVKIINVAEASRLTRLKPSTLYAYVTRRKIPFLKVGSRVLFNEQDLVTWLSRHRINPLDERYAGTPQEKTDAG